MEAAAVDWGYLMRTARSGMPDNVDADAQLMLRFKSGDAEAFEQLFSRHSRAIINFAYRFVRDRQLAEELAQDVFLRIYEGAARYEANARFTTWMYKIATNVCLNEIRKPRYRAVHEPIEPGEPGTLGSSGEAEKSLERQAIARAIRNALGELPEKQRTAFILNKYQDLSYVEVAEIMKVSEKAVKSLIHRAKEALAARLGPLLPGLLQT